MLSKVTVRIERILKIVTELLSKLDGLYTCSTQNVNEIIRLNHFTTSTNGISRGTF
jgi:hypothetical protein